MVGDRIYGMIASMKNVYIYLLRDPRNWEIFYIGKTINPRKRMLEHSHFKKGALQNSGRIRRLRAIAESNHVPKMEILQICPEWQWKEKERKWIKEYRDAGIKLTNLSDGGESYPSGRSNTPEVIAYRASKIRGFKHTEEAKARIKETNRVYWSDPAIRAKHAEIGRRGARKQWDSYDKNKRAEIVEKVKANLEKGLEIWKEMHRKETE